jgi:hypothetical protein
MELRTFRLPQRRTDKRQLIVACGMPRPVHPGDGSKTDISRRLIYAPAAPAADQVPQVNQLAQLAAVRAHGENAESALEGRGLRMPDQRRITGGIM